MHAAAPPSGVIVRSATPADEKALGRLGALLVEAHHAFDAERFIAPSPRTPRSYGSFLAGEMKRETVVVLVAEEAGAVVGYAYAAMEEHDWLSLRGPAGVIYDLIVDPKRRRGGVGRRLLEETVGRLAAMGAPRVVLSAAERNETARRLFASADFRPTMVEMTRELPGSSGD